MEKEQNKKENIFKKPWLQSIAVIVIIFGLLAAFLLWQSGNGTILIENSSLEAPIINLSPSTPGILNALYVQEGDHILVDSQVALVGSQIVSTKNDGIVVSAPKILGNYFAPGQTVVSVVNEQEMKVVGTVDETKGLKDIKIGQRATFTIDAFPGKEYVGVVEQISPVSLDTGVVFSISDKRPVKKFDIKINFNISSYPELKSGMSAKITVHTKG